MIKCKQALEGSTCGKICCCLECEEHNNCTDVCTKLTKSCGYAFTEETALTTMQNEAAAVIKVIADITVKKKELEDQEKKFKAELKDAMEKYGVDKFDTDIVKFTYVKPVMVDQFDLTALKKDLPDIAQKYTKQRMRTGYVKVTVK